MLLLYSLFRPVGTDVFDHICVGPARCRITGIHGPIPFKIPLAGVVNQFAPAVVDEDLEIVCDEESKYLKFLVIRITAGRPERSWGIYNRFAVCGDDSP